uniref:Putative secreted protein n=1 Tax=Ixodes ricinus TaxID=34613 RepID=A0A6B0U8E0_IXORI
MTWLRPRSALCFASAGLARDRQAASVRRLNCPPLRQCRSRVPDLPQRRSPSGALAPVPSRRRRPSAHRRDPGSSVTSQQTTLGPEE